MKFRLLVVLVLSGTAHADIVGGVDVRPMDPVSRSTVALYEPGPGGEGSLCTASVIGPHTAVTAAHCVSPGGSKPVLIFGNDVRSPQRELRPVSRVAVNPAWTKRQGSGMDQGDIALVKFGGGLPPDYQPVPMLQSDRELKKGKPVTLAGYGISDAREKSGAGILRKTKVRISSPRQGKSEMVLDQSRGRGACHGDSGGPAFVEQRGEPVLAGVTNRGYPNTAPDDCKHKVVYTKVSQYKPWIDQTEGQFEGDGRSEASRNTKAAKGRIRRRLPLGSRALAQVARASGHAPRRASHRKGQVSRRRLAH